MDSFPRRRQPLPEVLPLCRRKETENPSRETRPVDSPAAAFSWDEAFPPQCSGAEESVDELKARENDARAETEEEEEEEEEASSSRRVLIEASGDGRVELEGSLEAPDM